MSSSASSPHQRLRLAIRGAVQGVGFRPFVYRLATELGLKGWVNNSAQGVFVEVEGSRGRLEDFLLRIEREKPPRSSIQSLEPSWLDAVGYSSFEIRASEAGGARTALVLPDIATCPDCLSEIFDPGNRRHLYPFTNCTNCGPRFSIVEALPYDRPGTSMRKFTMCAQCQAEYENPLDRRFHAQPNACPVCGPRLELWDRNGKSSAGEPLQAAAAAIRAGKIVAVKGLGGFHLMVAAHDEGAVQRLRKLKHREEKPFALMFSSVESVKSACELSALEERLLRSPEAPIVLLRRSAASQDAARAKSHVRAALAVSVAPSNPNLGVMLPYTPLHHLLMTLLGFPVVATSGNLSDEPICTDEAEAVKRLGGIAELFLIHDRPIVRHVDDSIVRMVAGRELVLRRARGYAPLPIQLSEVGSRVSSVLAVGAHLKNAVALSVGPQVFVSQHIGDLETDEAYKAFRRVIADFERLYATAPEIVAADAHPDYLSTRFAKELTGSDARRRGSATPTEQGSPKFVSVQHHLAHVFSCMAENELTPPVLGVSWDGTGYGLDGTMWGGEFLVVAESTWKRVAHFRQFRLPGGDKAVREPRRTALGLLYEMEGEGVFERTGLAPLKSFSATEQAQLKTMLSRQLNSPLTSSVGRLFDAVASLAGVRQQVRFEGQAAMELEFALEGQATAECAEGEKGGPPERERGAVGDDGAYRMPLVEKEGPAVLDWGPMVEAILADIGKSLLAGRISFKFHDALVEGIIAVARRVGQERVVLSGGCFQNRYLTERAIQRLEEEGFRPYWQQRVPPNDGGIALGQVYGALKPKVEGG